MRPKRASRTATKVGRVVAYLAGHPDYAGLLPAGLAETNERVLSAAGLLSDRDRRRIADPRWRRFYDRLDVYVAGGQTLFIGLRKRLLHDEANAAIAGGCRQVLVIGGGLDTLALRLAGAHPQVTVVELDHPASQEVKRNALGRLGPLPANLHLVPADLSHSHLVATLGMAPGWDASAPAFAGAEGVFMYLDPDAVQRVLRALHASCGEGSKLLFSYIRRDERGRLVLGRLPRLAALGLALGGEPLRWAVRDGELGGFLAAAGWRLEIEAIDLRQRYLVPAGLGDRPLADVERYALARRSEMSHVRVPAAGRAGHPDSLEKPRPAPTSRSAEATATQSPHALRS